MNEKLNQEIEVKDKTESGKYDSLLKDKSSYIRKIRLANNTYEQARLLGSLKKQLKKTEEKIAKVEEELMTRGKIWNFFKRNTSVLNKLEDRLALLTNTYFNIPQGVKAHALKVPEKICKNGRMIAAGAALETPKIQNAEFKKQENSTSPAANDDLAEEIRDAVTKTLSETPKIPTVETPSTESSYNEEIMEKVSKELEKQANDIIEEKKSNSKPENIEEKIKVDHADVEAKTSIPTEDVYSLNHDDIVQDDLAKKDSSTDSKNINDDIFSKYPAGTKITIEKDSVNFDMRDVFNTPTSVPVTTGNKETTPDTESYEESTALMNPEDSKIGIFNMNSSAIESVKENRKDDVNTYLNDIKEIQSKREAAIEDARKTREEATKEAEKTKKRKEEKENAERELETYKQEVLEMKKLIEAKEKAKIAREKEKAELALKEVEEEKATQIKLQNEVEELSSEKEGVLKVLEELKSMQTTTEVAGVAENTQSAMQR